MAPSHLESAFAVARRRNGVLLCHAGPRLNSSLGQMKSTLLGANDSRDSEGISGNDLGCDGGCCRWWQRRDGDDQDKIYYERLSTRSSTCVDSLSATSGCAKWKA